PQPPPPKTPEPPPPAKPTHKSRPRHATPSPSPAPAAPSALTAADAARAHAAEKARNEMLAAAAQAAKEDAAQARPPAGVKLFIVSDPLKASVTAAWNGKSAAGTTPVVFRVRRGATVTVSFSKPGYASEIREIVAREAQAMS